MRHKAVSLGLLAVALSAILPGCGDEQGLTQNSLDQIKQKGERQRAIFTAAGGEWDKMSPADHKEFAGYFPSEEQAKQAWEVMKNPPTAGGFGRGPGQ